MIPMRRNKVLYAAAILFVLAAVFLLIKLRNVREASRDGRRAASESLIRH